MGEHVDDVDIFSEFRGKNFDIRSYTNSVITSFPVTDQLQSLRNAIQKLDDQIQEQINSRHKELLNQAVGVHKLEEVFQSIHSRNQSLLVSVERVRSRLRDPCSKLESRVSQLKRLLDTCELLRRVSRVLSLTSRLRTQMAGGQREMTRSANTLDEIAFVTSDMSLSGVTVIEEDLKFVQKSRWQLEEDAVALLTEGLNVQNEGNVANAVQTLFSLGQLDKAVEECVSSHFSAVVCLMKKTFKFDNISHGTSALPGRVSGRSMASNSAAFRASLWTNLEKLVDFIHNTVVHISLLRTILKQRKCPNTQILFLLSLEKIDGPRILLSFWGNILDTFRDELSTALEGSGFLQSALEMEYPKLVKLMFSLLQKLSTSLAFDESESLLDDDPLDSVAFTYEIAEQGLRTSMESLRSAYLSRSLSRMFEKTNLLFPDSSNTLPCEEEVNSVGKVFNSELSVSSFDADLRGLTVRNIAKAVKLFCAKMEQRACVDAEASQLTDVPTAGQRRNASIVTCLYWFRHLVQNLNVSDPCFQDAVQECTSLMSNVLSPLLDSIADASEDIMVTMFEEDFCIESFNEKESSKFMQEMMSFTSRMHKQFFAMFQCQDFIAEQIRPVSERILILFIRLSSLLRSLNAEGRKRLVQDYFMIETAVQTLAGNSALQISDLASTYRTLRACRTFVTQSAESIAKSSTLGISVSHSLAIFFLFSHAPPSFRSPHVASGWSISRFSRWLDSHTLENDRLSFLNGYLEVYVKEVRQRGEKEFAPVYPFMVSVLQNGLSAQRE